MIWCFIILNGWNLPAPYPVQLLSFRSSLLREFTRYLIEVLSIPHLYPCMHAYKVTRLPKPAVTSQSLFGSALRTLVKTIATRSIPLAIVLFKPVT
jgi:hypothetical protein